ncbi:MAG: glycerate kinase [Leptolyngbya sp. Prado105]|nr:glycerate kinase [Leptolyngbya sp. Prado105]
MDIDDVSEKARSQFLKENETAIANLCTDLDLIPDQETIENVWLPLAFKIASWRNAQTRCFVQGFLGGQGTGKTTLTKVLTLLLNRLGYSTVSWSIDDLYLPYVDRVTLRNRDPRIVRRGPPGTHDVPLGIDILQQFRAGNFPIELPRFDKSLHGGEGDRTAPEIIEQADIILFEGWLVGVRPIVSEFEKVRDPQFAKDMNQQLQRYVPLWELLDRLIVLHIQDYQLSKQWRKQAEHKMIAQGKPGMSDAEIDQFVEYFWNALHPELLITPMLQSADLVLEIGEGHAVLSNSLSNGDRLQ